MGRVFSRSVNAMSYLGNHLLNAPLFALYTLLPFILVKDLHATALQIILLVAAKPTVAILSTYWSLLVGRGRLKASLIGATLLGITPTILFPILGGNWLFIGAFAAYFFTERAVIPAWMEILKLSSPKEQMSRTVARGSLIIFIAAAILPLFAAPVLDHHIGLWRWLFAGAAILSLLRVPLQALLSIRSSRPAKESPTGWVLHPWKSCFSLLKRRPDFAWYQLIFFFGGLGIMVTQPALPQFVEKVLQLSYTEVALAFALCKGVGFALTNPLWARWIHKVDLYLFCSAVTLCAALSLFLVLFSPYTLVAIYLSCFCYGLMQAGSQLSWQMAGPLFSGEEDSSPYTSTNILMVGLRGCVGPLVGGAVCAIAGLQLPYVIGGGLCLVGCGLGLAGSRLRHRLGYQEPPGILLSAK